MIEAMARHRLERPREQALALDPDLHDEAVPHPRTRGECQDGPRPCPLVGCSMNLYLSVRSDGSILYTHPGREPWEMPEEASCTLDVIDQNPDGLTLEEIGAIFNLTRERVRQIEMKWKRAIQRSPALRVWLGESERPR